MNNKRIRITLFCTACFALQSMSYGAPKKPKGRPLSKQNPPALRSYITREEKGTVQQWLETQHYQQTSPGQYRPAQQALTFKAPPTKPEKSFLNKVLHCFWCRHRCLKLKF